MGQMLKNHLHVSYAHHTNYALQGVSVTKQTPLDFMVIIPVSNNKASKVTAAFMSKGAQSSVKVKRENSWRKK